MKKRIREATIAISLLSAVSAFCIKGMKSVGEKIQKRVDIESKNSYINKNNK